MQDQQEAAEELIRRVVGDRASRITVDMSSGDTDQVEIEASDGTVRLKGSSGVAVAVGLRHYLREACGVQVTWLDEPLPLPDSWPSLGRKSVTARFPVRYHLNYVTFAYSTVYWDWERWQREIDRMAMHGINAPLALTGHEAVWRAVLRGEGMSDDQIAAYLGGATYLPFLWMGCLEGWDRPLPDGWIDTRERLGQQIVERERSLGMRPVLPGFAGHVPAALAGDSTLRPRPGTPANGTLRPRPGTPANGTLRPRPGRSSHNEAVQLTWEGFHTRQLPADHPDFLRLAARMREEQRARFGGDHLYSADPFIEMVPTSGDPSHLSELAKRIREGITVDDPDAIWVFQAWPFYYQADFWTPERVQAFLESIPSDRLLVLDLWAEHLPLWQQTANFADRPWLWSVVHNFGQRSGLFGDVRALLSRFADAAHGAASGQLRGIGLAMEGLGTNPAIYDLVTDLAWDEPPPDGTIWLVEWAERRYGTSDHRVQEAWRLLADTAYGHGRDLLPPSPVVRRPGMDDDSTADWAPDAALPQLISAWQLMLEANDSVQHRDPYERDLVDVGQQVLVAAIGRHRRAVTAASREGDSATARVEGEHLLTLLDDLDELLATRHEYLLGRWLASARSWGATPAERLHLERSARRQLTVWGHPDTNLFDYAGRHWAGLVRGFYRPRFQIWLDWIAIGGSGVELDRALASFEELWIRRSDEYEGEPQGDPSVLSSRLSAQLRAQPIR